MNTAKKIAALISEINESKLSVGTIVKVVPKVGSDKDFMKKFNNKVGTIDEVDPVSGHSGYSVYVTAVGSSVTLDLEEVVELKGSQLEKARKVIEEG